MRRHHPITIVNGSKLVQKHSYPRRHNTRIQRSPFSARGQPCQIPHSFLDFTQIWLKPPASIWIYRTSVTSCRPARFLIPSKVRNKYRAHRKATISLVSTLRGKRKQSFVATGSWTTVGSVTNALSLTASEKFKKRLTLHIDTKWQSVAHSTASRWFARTALAVNSRIWAVKIT